MSTERIDIVVSLTGDVGVRRNLTSIGAAAVGANQGVSLLQQGLAALGIGFSLGGIARELDKVSQTKTRIAAIADEGENVGQTFKKLASLANDVRLPLEETVKTYQRIGFSLKDLGKTQNETLRIVELLSKAYQISGATSQEAAQSARQFSQAVSRGRLGEQELNSVLEEAPGLSKAIAQGFRLTESELAKLNSTSKNGREFFDMYGRQLDVASLSTNKYRTVIDETGRVMQVLEKRTTDLNEKQKISGALLEKLRKNQGVSVGDLKTLSQAGFLEGTRFIDALVRQGDTLDAQFKRIPVTLTQAVTVLRNQIDILFLRFDEKTGIVDKLSAGILKLANNMDVLEGAMVALATVGIPLVIAGIARLTIALVGSGLGAFIVLAGAAAGTLFAFRNEIKLDEAGLISLSNVFDGLGIAIEKAFGRLKNIKQIFPIFNESLDRFRKVNAQFNGVGQSLGVPQGVGGSNALLEAAKILASPVGPGAELGARAGQALRQKLEELAAPSGAGAQLGIITGKSFKDELLRNQAGVGGQGLGGISPSRGTLLSQGQTSQSLIPTQQSKQELQQFADVARTTFNQLADGALDTGRRISDSLIPDTLKTGAIATFDAVKGKIEEINQTVETAKSIGSVFDQFINGIRQPLFGFISGLSAAITELAAIVEIAVAKIEVAIAKLQGTLAQVSAGIQSLANQNFDIQGAGNRILESFKKGFAGGESNFFRDFAGDIAKGAIESANALDTAKQSAEGTGQALGGAADQSQRLGDNLSRLPETGGKALTDLGNKARTIQQDLQQLVQSLASNLENAIVDFVVKGKFDFKSLINSFIADITRFAVRTLILKPLLGGLFGGGGGGGGGLFGFAGGGSVPGFANGGSIPRFGTGGMFDGQGGPLSDRLLARVSPKEFIVNARSAQENMPVLDYINRGGVVGDSKTTGSTVFAPVIQVTVESNGREGGSEQGAKIAQVVEMAVQQQFAKLVRKETRPGGTLRQDKASY